MQTKKWKNNHFLLKRRTSPPKRDEWWPDCLVPRLIFTLQQRHTKLLMVLSLVTLVSWKCACLFPGQSCCPTSWFLAFYPLSFPKSNTSSICKAAFTGTTFFAYDFLIKMDLAKLHLLNCGFDHDNWNLTDGNNCLKLSSYQHCNNWKLQKRIGAAIKKLQWDHLRFCFKKV